MEEQHIEWVVYQPPKSADFGHHSLPRDPRHAWPKVKSFISDFAESEPVENVSLTCFGPDYWVDRDIATARANEAQQLFGDETDPSGPHRHWFIAESQLERAVEFALDDDKFPKQQIGPTSLHFAFWFYWRDCKRVAPRKGAKGVEAGKSSLGIGLGHRALFLQPQFIFQAFWESDEVKEFIAKIEPACPFRFRDGYFKRAIPGEGRWSPGSGQWWKLIKLDEDWRK